VEVVRRRACHQPPPKNLRERLDEVPNRRIRTRPHDGFWQIAIRVNDQIHIEELEVFAHVGVPEEERGAAQRLTFYLTLWPARSMDEVNDDIDRAVNYATVCAEVEKFVEARRDRLIETLANALALHLLKMFEIQRITVELRKYILPQVKFVSVSVTRERAQH
jgi:FolB domain-containing protein